MKGHKRLAVVLAVVIVFICTSIQAVTDSKAYVIFVLERTIPETVEIGKYESKVFPARRSLETHPAGIHLDPRSLKKVNFVRQ